MFYPFIESSHDCINWSVCILRETVPVHTVHYYQTGIFDKWTHRERSHPSFLWQCNSWCQNYRKIWNPRVLGWGMLYMPFKLEALFQNMSYWHHLKSVFWNTYILLRNIMVSNKMITSGRKKRLICFFRGRLPRYSYNAHYFIMSYRF